MELEELKASWDNLSKKMEEQQTLNSKLIEQMTTHNYKSKLTGIFYPEWIGSIICGIAALLLIWNFGRLDNLTLQLMGGLSVLLLIAISLFSFKSTRGLKRINLSLSSYTNTLKEFAIGKKRFQKLQKLNLVLCSLLMVVFIPASVKLLTGKDIMHGTTFGMVILPVYFLFLIFFSRWALSGYNRALRQAETVLAELQD
jgi:hypothetical protein